MANKKKLSKKKGFTLIEIILSIVVISISLTAIPYFYKILSTEVVNSVNFIRNEYLVVNVLEEIRKNYDIILNVDGNCPTLSDLVFKEKYCFGDEWCKKNKDNIIVKKERRDDLDTDLTNKVYIYEITVYLNDSYFPRESIVLSVCDSL